MPAELAVVFSALVRLEGTQEARQQAGGSVGNQVALKLMVEALSGELAGPGRRTAERSGARPARPPGRAGLGRSADAIYLSPARWKWMVLMLLATPRAVR